MTDDGRLSRRRLLASGAAGAGALGIAGCLGDDGDDTETGTNGSPTDTDDGTEANGAPNFPEVEDPPEAVYLPTHREAMVHLEPVHAGDYAFAPMVTYPHRFWLVTGETVERTEPTDEDVHLMVTAWDRQTGTVVPIDASVRFETYGDGALVDERNPWLMLSQQMGFHFGDNVPLDGDGTYRVEGRIGALDVRKTGAFAGRFDEPVSFEFEFEFDDEFRQIRLEVDYFDEGRWGEPDALEPMGNGNGDGGDEGHDDDHGHHDVPYSSLPPAEELPGTLQGTPTSGDAVFATTLLEAGSRFVDGDEPYLAVSPRTPYNRCVLPLMTLDAVHEPTAESFALTGTIDDELGFHYGTALPSAADGDELTLEVLAPPQAARHQGYETAFVDMPSMALSLSP